MVSAGSLELVVELMCPPNNLWEAIKDLSSLLPKVLPETFKSIEVLNDINWGKNGCVTLWKFHPSTLVEGAPIMMVEKRRIENVDELNKTLTYSAIDGDILKLYKIYKAIIEVTPKTNKQGDEDQGSIMKWSAQFEKVNEMVPDPHMIKEMIAKTMHLLDAYLLSSGSDETVLP